MEQLIEARDDEAIARVTNQWAGSMRESHRRLRRREMMRRGAVVTLRIGIVAAALLTWELLSRSEKINPLFFSRPSSVYQFLIQDWQQLLDHAVFTLHAVVFSFVIASFAGIACGLLLARFELLATILQPIFVFLNSLPRIALVPLFILWFGITFEAKVATAFTLVFFIVLISTQAGLANVDRDLLIVTKLLGGNTRQVYFKVALPSAIPAIFGGLQLAVSYSILGVVGSEMIASQNGLGQLISFYGNNLQAAGVFAVLLVLGMLATLVSGVLGIVERRLSRWNVTDV